MTAARTIRENVEVFATLENKIDRLLGGPALAAMMRAQGLALRSVSAPKQTETTQRWELLLEAPGTRSPISTKIEFSRRSDPKGHAFAPADAAIAKRYLLAAPLAHHYLAPAAIGQKIGALAHRSQTQARDIFDLHLLLTAVGASDIELDREALRDVPRAIERAIDVSFDEYDGQVVAFLEPEHASIYGSRDAWNQMQSDVVAGLEAFA